MPYPSPSLLITPGQGVIFSDALLAIISYGEGILGITVAAASSSSSSSDPKQQQQQLQRQLRRRTSLEGSKGVGQQSIGEGTAAYKSHVEEWAGWKVCVYVLYAWVSQSWSLAASLFCRMCDDDT